DIRPRTYQGYGKGFLLASNQSVPLLSERHPPVRRMAASIHQRPAVTARPLDHHLSFAQQRSVYYCLPKAGVARLTPFRAAVLTGKYPVATAAPQRPLRAARVAEVPLVSAAPSPPAAPHGYVVTTQPVSHGAFALTVDSDDYRPLVERNDVLLIDPGQPPAD